MKYVFFPIIKKFFKDVLYIYIKETAENNFFSSKFLFQEQNNTGNFVEMLRELEIKIKFDSQI